METKSGTEIGNSGQIKVVNVAYAWTINNFDSHLANLTEDNDNEASATFFESPKFSSESNGEFKWRLRLHSPRGSTDRHLSLYLRLESRPASIGTRKVSAKFRASIYDGRDDQHRHKSLGAHDYTEENPESGFTHFVSRDCLLRQADDLLPNGQLTILCLISTDVDFSSKVDEDQPGYREVNERLRVVDDLEAMLESKVGSDIRFRVFGIEFHAHKCILAARSPRLLEILEARIRQGSGVGYDKSSEITDVDPEVMTEVLRFIYCGRIECLERLADGLLSASEKYKLERLKVISEKMLIDSITVYDASYLLTIADRYGASKLKKKAVDFIVAHREEVLVTPGFKMLMNKSPNLLADIYRTATLHRHS